MPVNDGNVIRLTLPQLSGERRKELVKNLKKDGESQKVFIRNIRRDINLEIKKQEKKKNFSEDESRRIQDKVQKLTDKYIKKIDELTEAKQKEVMEV